jgi:uncharacterized Zn-binding protein involved in type VI secretion
MRRAILKLGDTTTAGGRVLEGVDTCTHHGTPITFIGARIWCPACNSTGIIGSKGPHQSATMMGKQQALDGDICLCKCDPPPICLASQDSAWHEVEAHEMTGTGYVPRNETVVSSFRSAYDEQFVLRDATGKCLADTYYTAHLSSGELVHGITDSMGRTHRYPTDGAQRVVIHLGHLESVQ